LSCSDTGDQPSNDQSWKAGADGGYESSKRKDQGTQRNSITSGNSIGDVTAAQGAD
jgi:hypothetical protein